MRPALALFSVSLRQALPRKRTLMLLFLVLAPAGIYLAATTNRTQEFALESAVQVGGSVFFSLVLPVVAMVIAAGVLGSERRDQTLSFIVLRPIPKSAIAAAKKFAALCAASAITLIGAIALAGAHAVRTGDSQLFLGLMLGALVATAAYTAILLPLGFLSDRAVIMGMAYLLIFENGIVSLLPALASLSAWRLGVAAFVSVTPNAAVYAAGLAGHLSLSAAESILSASIFLLVGIAVTTVLLRTKDLV